MTIRTTCNKSSSCSFCRPWANLSISLGLPVHSFPFAAPLDFFRWWSSVVSSLRLRFSSGAEGAGAGGAGVGGVYPGVSPDSAKSFRRPGEGLLNSWKLTKNLVIRTYQNVCYLILGLLEMKIVGQVFCTAFLSIV